MPAGRFACVRVRPDSVGRSDDSRNGEPEDVCEEVRPGDELHREEDGVRLGDDELVEVHEVRVMNVGEGPELLLEPIERGGAESKQRLEGDALAPIAVERLVDGAHATGPDAADDLVPSGALPLGVGIQRAGNMNGVCRHLRRQRDLPHYLQSSADFAAKGRDSLSKGRPFAARGRSTCAILSQTRVGLRFAAMRCRSSPRVTPRRSAVLCASDVRATPGAKR